MKTMLQSSLALLGLALAGAGCTTTSLPRVTYPVTYQIQLSNTQVRSDYGPQNLNINATQDVTVSPNEPLYYQVSSPVEVVVYVYELDAVNQRTLLGQNEGTLFNSYVVPPTSTLEFVFSVAQANSSGVLQFTISDQPIGPTAPPIGGP